MTLCLAVSSLSAPVHTPLGVNITENELNVLPQQYCEAAQAALEVGDWTGLPRIRTLQAIALLSPYFLYRGSPATGLRHQTCELGLPVIDADKTLMCIFLVDLGVAIRMCQQLGLHQLGEHRVHLCSPIAVADPRFSGDDPSTMPPEDVSLPSGVNSLRREIPLRLMRNILFVEYISIDKIKSGLPPSLSTPTRAETL